MNRLTVAGGVYHEECIWPFWDEIYGSAGRAAAAVRDQVEDVRLVTCLRSNTEEHFSIIASAYGFSLDSQPCPQTISFDYFHSLSTPVIRPVPALITPQPILHVSDDIVLRFGMMETSVKVTAKKCVYDPQSAFAPESFSANGSSADSLAIVANAAEIAALSKNSDALSGAEYLVEFGHAEVVVVKSGPEGAFIVEKGGVAKVPAYQSTKVWTIGTGDVFAGIFAAQWGVHGLSPVEASRIASRAVAFYVEGMSLPVPPLSQLENYERSEVKVVPSKVYLASPFFCMGQRWMVDEARRCLRDFGLQVFSPIHDVGAGPAAEIAPADLAGLEDCDVVFAFLDGLDPGTIFEIGYARAKGIPVYVVAQAVAEEDLKMIAGTDCKIYDDFVTAIHHLAWRS